MPQAYVAALQHPAHVHTICEEYRAAADIDREHDKADLDAGRRIACPFLVLWSDRGGLASWYEDAGGPLGHWQRWARDVRGQAVPAGIFFPEEMPRLTADIIGAFLPGGSAGPASLIKPRAARTPASLSFAGTR